MFFSNKAHIQFRSNNQDKPLSTFLGFNSNKENHIHPTYSKSQFNCYPENETRDQNLPIREAECQTKNPNNYIDTANNGRIISRSSVPNNKNAKSKEKLCPHERVEKVIRGFCKECGVFMPKNQTIAYQEELFKHKMENHPDEIYQIMLDRENINRVYLKESPHLKFRKILVDWICKVSVDHEFSSDTTHITISYLDAILSQFDISKNYLQLVALCCLVIAAKFSEKEEKVPSYKSLFELCRGNYSLEHFIKFEKLILEKLNWNLKIISPLQFARFYLSKGCAFSSDFSAIRDVDSKLLRYLRKYSEFFLDLSLHNYDLNAYKSHVLACAAIGSARKAVGLFPIWSSELVELSGTTWREIEACFTSLYSTFENDHPEIAKKANSYADKFLKKDEVIELEESYAAMTIESGVTTPLHQVEYKDEDYEQKSSKKKARPSTLMHETKRFKTNMDWTSREAAQKLGKCESICINLIKRVSNNMSIESLSEDYSQKDQFQNTIKRNLVF